MSERLYASFGGGGEPCAADERKNAGAFGTFGDIKQAYDPREAERIFFDAAGEE